MLKALALAAFVALAPTGAMAQLQHPEPGPAGGLLLDAGAYHVELLAKGGDFQVFIYDGENKPLPTKGGKANVTVLHNKKQENFTLAAAEPNLFKGKSPIEAGAGMKVLVAFNLAGKDETQARFKPMN